MNPKKIWRRARWRKSLARFVMAQDVPSGSIRTSTVTVYERALTELRQGRRRNHWGPYIFPRLPGIGERGDTQYFILRSQDECLAYWEHPVLGPRLRECIGLVGQYLTTPRATLRQLFGNERAARRFVACLRSFVAVTQDAQLKEVQRLAVGPSLSEMTQNLNNMSH